MNYIKEIKINNTIHILQSIDCDKHNIQVMIDLIPLCTTKSEERTLKAVIKTLVKEIHNSKCLIDEKMFDSQEKVQIPLFEVEASPVTILEEYQDMSSFFGKLEGE